MEINSRMSSILYLILASKGRISMESLMEETSFILRFKQNQCMSDRQWSGPDQFGRRRMHDQR